MNPKIKITAEQKEILFGTLLGNGWLESSTGGQTYRFGFKQKLEQTSYVTHVWSALEPLCGSPPITNQEDFQFKTLTLGVLRFYGHQFYAKDRKKKVPRLIHRWLTPRALAYWYMDDGYKDKKNACLLCTDSFEKKDVEKLCTALQRNFELTCWLRKKQVSRNSVWRIYISTDNVEKFLALIDPYIVESMRYKLPGGSE